MAEGDEALGQTPVQSEDVESAQQPSLVNGVEAKDVEVERSGEDGVSEGLQEDDRDDKKVSCRSEAVAMRTADPRLVACCPQRLVLSIFLLTGSCSRWLVREVEYRIEDI